MIPVLYDKNTTDFTTNGIGRLKDTISCVVTEERNGVFELEMTYPVDGVLYDSIELAKIVGVMVDDRRDRQAFDIYYISEPIDGVVTINAQHITYRLNYIPVSPCTGTGIQETIDAIMDNTMEDNPFTLWSNVDNATTTYNQTEPKAFRGCLGGTQGSLLDTFAGAGTGEYEWDNFTVKFWLHRGEDIGAELRYALNITDLVKEQDSSETYTGAIAYWMNEDGSTVLYGQPQYSPNRSLFPYNKTVLLDVSSEMAEPPSLTQLNNMASDYVVSAGVPKESIRISFIDITDTEEFKAIAPLQKVHLCDTILVNYSPLNISTKKKVVKTVWDVLKERYNSIEIGDTRSNLASTLADNIGDITSIVQNNTKLVSVVQNINREVGDITSAVTVVNEDINGIKADLTEVQQTSSSFNITIENIQSQVNDAVGTVNDYEERIQNVESTTQKVETHFDFGINGLTISSSQDAEYQTVVDNTGLKVVKGNDGEVLTATNEGVNAYDLTARNYLIIDLGYKARFQKYADSYDANQIGCFWIEEG